MTQTPLAPVIALSHGGGPMPILGDPAHANLVKSMTHRVPELLKLGTPSAPKAIVLVTAHWSTQRLTISSAQRHELYYDYYNFPKEAYGLKYPAPGSPEVAEEVRNVFAEAGLDAVMDGSRGWDHGVFVPMLLINPTGDIPIVQVSVLESEDPTQHFLMGQALSALRTKNIAIIGSGFASFHNLRIFRTSESQSREFVARNDEWSRHVTDAAGTADEAERGRKMAGWRGWPNAFEMHPRGGAEHFLPLVVCAGAGGGEGARWYVDEFRGWKIYSYYWA